MKTLQKVQFGTLYVVVQNDVPFWLVRLVWETLATSLTHPSKTIISAFPGCNQEDNRCSQESCFLEAYLTSVSSHPVSVWVSVIVMSLCYDYVIVMFHFFAKLLQKINIFYIYISILCTYISNLSSNIIFAKEKFWKVVHSLWKVANSPTMIC